MPLACAKSRRIQRNNRTGDELEKLDRQTQFETGLTGTPYAALQLSCLLRMGLRWRGDELVWFDKGSTRQQSIRQCVDLCKRWTGQLRVRFADGATLDIDPYAARAPELLALIAEQVTDNAFDEGGNRVR